MEASRGAWLPLFTEMLLRAETGLVDAASYLPIRTEHRSSQLIGWPIPRRLPSLSLNQAPFPKRLPSLSPEARFTGRGGSGGGGAGGGATSITQESVQQSEAGELSQNFDVS